VNFRIKFIKVITKINTFIKKNQYNVDSLFIFFKHPLAWFFFVFFLFLNSILFLIFILLYFIKVFYWLFLVLKLLKTKNGSVYIKKNEGYNLNVYLNYIYIETEWKSTILSFNFIYILFKKIYNRSDFNINLKLILNLILNFIIRQITGFSRIIIINSFKISLKLKKWQNYTRFNNSLFFDVIPIIAGDYIKIEEYKIYFENNELKFNPFKLIKINQKFFMELKNFTENNSNEIDKINYLSKTLSDYVTIQNLEIKNVKSIHTCFVSKFYESKHIRISTLTNTNNKIDLKTLFTIENNFTNKKSKVLESEIFLEKDIKEVFLNTINLNDSRVLLNNISYKDLYIQLLILKNNYGLKFINEKNDIKFSKEIKDKILDFKDFQEKRINTLSDDEKKLYLLSSLYKLNTNSFDYFYNNKNIIIDGV